MMQIERAYKTELKVNNKQMTMLRGHVGAARFAWNWGLERKINVRNINQLPISHIKYPTAIDLHKELNVLKKDKYSWMYNVSKCAPQEALRDLDKAFKNFFEGRAGYPRFKSRKNNKHSFRLYGAIHVFDDRIQLPKLGKIRLKERNYIPIDAHILSATVSEKAGRWYVSVMVREDVDVQKNVGGTVGVDLGVKELATVSDGTIIHNPKALFHYQKKLKRQQRGVSRKKKNSNNRKKAVKGLQRIHQRIEHIRKDVIHKATTQLARTKSHIVIEDLNVSGMMKNHNLANSIFDAAMRQFRRQLEYKTQWYGSELTVADRWYPSSKTCSNCGHIKDDLKLSDRVFGCKNCHLQIDRDLNASINLSSLAVSSMERENACLRWEVADESQCPSMIQESDSTCISSEERFVNSTLSSG